MRLEELDPSWLYVGSTPNSYRREDIRLNRGNAQGVLFLCPTCFVKNNGPVGTHTIICWFADRDVPPEVMPGIHRWKTSGGTVHDLTLDPSIDSGQGHWHGWIKNGEVT